MAYCDRCDRPFPYWSSYYQHVSDSSRHHLCDNCDEDFETWAALRQHYIQSPEHHFCRACDAHFVDGEELVEHCLADHCYCDRCDRFFRNATGLHEHRRQSSNHPYCDECQCMFNSESNLRAHMNSSVHRPRNVQCAFHFRGCKRCFVTMSAMVLHLESGSCPSGADRQSINRWIQLNDRRNAITNPSRLLTDGGSTRYIATERSWNARVNAYQCVLCQRTFDTLEALNRHLASPRHEERIYRCPLSSCHMTFSTLSALCQHVESESCGVLRFREVHEGIDNFLNRLGRLRIEG